MATLREFKRKYSARLYENLELYVNRRVPIWPVCVDELRSVLGADGVSPGWGQFNAYVLKPAMAEVNEVADFEVGLEITKRRGRKVQEVAFHLYKSRDRQARESSARTRNRAKDQPVYLSPETLDRARKKAPGWDVHQIQAAFMEKVRREGVPKNPDGAFLRFAEKWHRNRTSDNTRLFD